MSIPIDKTHTRFLSPQSSWDASGINGEGGFKRGRWETLVIQFGETSTRAFLNGAQVFDAAVNLADSYADCYDAGGYFVIAGDNDGDDNACYWADVKVYDGIVDP